MTQRRPNAVRCEAQFRSMADRDRCVLPFGVSGHRMAQSHKGELALPVLIHRTEDGREWTINGPFVRAEKQEV